MAKEVSEDIGGYYHYYPALAVIVTAHAGGRDNAMAAAWHTPLSKRPPLYGVAISPKRFTYKLIVDSKEFAVNFVPASEVELVAAVGGSKGNEVDKFSAFNIDKDKPLKTGAPVLSAAYVTYECKLVEDRGYGDHRLLVGQVVAVHWLKKAFTVDEVLDLARINPVLYLGHDRYITGWEGTIRTVERKAYGKKV